MASSVTPGTPEIATCSSRWASPPAGGAALSDAVVPDDEVAAPELPHAAAARIRTRNAPAKPTRLEWNTAPPVVLSSCQGPKVTRVLSRSDSTAIGDRLSVRRQRWYS